jgi:DNA end-binding protein Ku
LATSWKGSISFGLIYIPIGLQLAAGEESIGFNMLHKGCGGRINYKKVCSLCGKELVKEDIVKGYNYEEGKYVVMDDDEFELLKTPKNKSITIEQFVNLNEIDPIFYEKSYYVIPSGGEKAFELLKQAMSQENKVGIAKIVLGTKESLVALRVNNGNMLLNTLFFVSELRSAPAFPLGIAVAPAEVDMARTLINSMASAFQPETYRDEYQERIKEAIEQKISGQEIITSQQEQPGKVIDLMEALQASLKARENSQNQRRTS